MRAWTAFEEVVQTASKHTELFKLTNKKKMSAQIMRQARDLSLTTPSVGGAMGQGIFKALVENGNWKHHFEHSIVPPVSFKTRLPIHT